MKDAFTPGQSAVVTGAGSGLGRAFCLKLAEGKTRILACDINEEAAEETARLVAKLGAEARVLRADVSHWEDVLRVKDEAEKWFGSPQWLINNAGIGSFGLLEDNSLDDWERVLAVNLWGVIYGCQAFLPGMKSNGLGYIVNVASLAGLVSAPNMGPYNVSKAGVISYTETLYAELGPTEVHATVLCPSFFRTNIVDSSPRPISPKARAWVERTMDSSKIQAPEVAEAGIRSALRNDLYTVPMADARRTWYLKRLFPVYLRNRLRKFVRPKR